MNTNVKLVTDGACSGNPGPGGWCALLSVPSKELVLRGYCLKTTNNAMELQAVLSGLRALKCPCRVEIVSDSKYVVEGINTWVSGWKRNGWRTAAKKPVANLDLWEPIAELMCVHVVKARWVKGHYETLDNIRADQIAREESRRGWIKAQELRISEIKPLFPEWADDDDDNLGDSTMDAALSDVHDGLYGEGRC